MPAPKQRLGSPQLPDCTFSQFVWLWNKLQGRDTPDVHIRITKWLGRAWKGHEHRLLLMAFRDCGKSTVVGLHCAWLLMQRPDIRILVLAAEQELARKMVRNVKAIIEKHPLTRPLVPRKPEQWSADAFTVRRTLELRDPSLLARGIGANITGSRADYIICDDVEVPNTCNTALKRAELRARLAECRFILVPGGTHLFVGTPHSFFSIYADVPRKELGETETFLEGFRRLTVPILNPDGSSAWPERFTPAEIKDIKKRTGVARFTSQMMLQPVDLREMRLDPARLIRYAEDIELDRVQGRSRRRLAGRELGAPRVWWDPAYGRPDKGDSSVIALVYSDDDGGFYLHDIAYLKHDPARVGDADEAEQLLVQVIAFLARHDVPGLHIEANGIGKFLPGMLRRHLKQAGLRIGVKEEITSRNKDERILDAFDPLLAASALRVHERVLRTPFPHEMSQWQPGGRCHDDGLDAVAGCLLLEPARFKSPSGAVSGANRAPFASFDGFGSAQTEFTP